MPDCTWRAACAGIAADTTRFPAIPGATRPISPPAAAARTAAKPARSPAIRAGAIRASSCRTASAAHLRLRRLLRLQAARVCSNLACRTICREHTAATAARLSCSATGAARETYAIPAYLTARNARERKPAVPGATSANSTSSRKRRSATFRAETIELLPKDRLKRFRICRRISAMAPCVAAAPARSALLYGTSVGYRKRFGQDAHQLPAQAGRRRNFRSFDQADISADGLVRPHACWARALRRTRQDHRCGAAAQAHRGRGLVAGTKPGTSLR